MREQRRPRRMTPTQFVLGFLSHPKAPTLGPSRKPGGFSSLSKDVHVFTVSLQNYDSNKN